MVREFELLRQEELAAKLRVFLESDHTTAKQQHKLHSDFRSLKKEEAMLEYLRLREVCMCGALKTIHIST